MLISLRSTHFILRKYFRFVGDFLYRRNFKRSLLIFLLIMSRWRVSLAEKGTLRKWKFVVNFLRFYFIDGSFRVNWKWIVLIQVWLVQEISLGNELIVSGSQLSDLSLAFFRLMFFHLHGSLVKCCGRAWELNRLNSFGFCFDNAWFTFRIFSCERV